MEDNESGQLIPNSDVKHVTDIVGEWGKWQFNFAAHVFILWSIAASNSMGFAFMGYNNKFWCSDSPIDVSLPISDH